MHLYYSPLSLTAAAHASSNAHTHTGISGPRPIRGGVRTSLSLIGLDHDMSLTCLLSNSRDFELRRLCIFFFFCKWLDAPVRPTFFFSRTLEKLGRTCDQIGRTLEPCFRRDAQTDLNERQRLIVEVSPER